MNGRFGAEDESKIILHLDDWSSAMDYSLLEKRNIKHNFIHSLNSAPNSPIPSISLRLKGKMFTLIQLVITSLTVSLYFSLGPLYGESSLWGDYSST